MISIVFAPAGGAMALGGDSLSFGNALARRQGCPEHNTGYDVAPAVSRSWCRQVMQMRFLGQWKLFYRSQLAVELGR
jgi:hypothetical protein